MCSACGQVSIVTRTGDDGTTGLMFNRRVPKTHPRIQACGAVDELNAALGVVHASTSHPEPQRILLPIQQDLVNLMGELATLAEDLERYRADGYATLTADLTMRLEAEIRNFESHSISFKGWATPGANPVSAALDVARTVCRRAEREACALQESGQLMNKEILVYLNRLSDLLFILARVTNKRSGIPEPLANFSQRRK